MEKLKVGSDFSGVGAFDQALIRLGVDYETVFACDMDKYARQTYIHNYGEPDYFPENVYHRKIPGNPLGVYMTSPPCQAFSLAGKRAGEDDKRGVLFYNSHEFIQKNNPRYFIFENVKGLLSDDSGKTFQKWIDLLGGKSVNGNPMIFPHQDSVPYHVYYKVLNAKDFNIPQNRERIFIVGIRDDLDNNFRWPKPVPLKKRLKDILEENVDPKYHLSDKLIQGFINHADRQKENGNGFSFEPKTPNDILNCVTTKEGSRGYNNFIKEGFVNQNTQASQVYSEDGILPNICAGTHGYANGYVKVRSATKNGYETAHPGYSINFSQPNSDTRRGRVGKEVLQTLDTACNQGVIQLNNSKESGRKQPYKQNRVYDAYGISPVLDTECGRSGYKVDQIIRRITPREAFRGMDFPDSFSWPVSDTQAYRQAGNSICVGVLAEILKKLL